MMNELTYIYALTDPDSNIKQYVGKADDPGVRYRAHLEPCKLRAKSHKNHWLKSLLRRGKKPGLVILAKVDAENANIAEIAYIAAFRMMGFKLTNGTDGGEGQSKGYRPSEEARRKISDALKGSKNALGYKHTAEAKRNMSEAQKGKPSGMKDKKHSEETRRKLSEAMKGNKNGLGWKHTEDARQKMSKTRKGRKYTEETRQKISDALKGNKNALDHKHTEKTRRKISEAQKGNKNAAKNGGL